MEKYFTARISVIIENEETTESVTCDVVDTTLTEFKEDAEKTAIDEAAEQNWNIDDVRYEIAPLDEQDDDYVIQLIEAIFPIEEAEYDYEEPYDVLLTDAETEISDYMDKLLVGIFHDDGKVPTLIKAVVKSPDQFRTYDQPNSENVDIVVYKVK